MKVHNKLKNFCIYLRDVSPPGHFDSKLLRPVVIFLLPMGAMGSFMRANLRRCALYFKACMFAFKTTSNGNPIAY